MEGFVIPAKARALARNLAALYGPLLRKEEHVVAKDFWRAVEKMKLLMAELKDMREFNWDE